jgi:ABC-type antimicrobial peptide transport system permease subunit
MSFATEIRRRNWWRDIEVDAVVERLAWVPQVGLGLLPRTIHRGLGWLLGKQTDEARGIEVLWRSAAGAAIGFVTTLFLFNIVIGVLALWARVFPGLVQTLADHGIIAEDSGWLNLQPAGPMVQAGFAFALMYLTGLTVRAPYDGFGRPFRALRGILWLREVIARIAGLLCLMGLGLLPLASLLMFLPLVMPQEAVLTDTLRPARTRLARAGRRAVAVVTGLVVLLSLMTFGVQLSTWFGWHSEIYANLARQLLPNIVLDRLPTALVEGWPFVLLFMYATDFVLLFFIGRVPLQYNLRNLRVRWITTVMTGVAFTVVVFLLVLMMSFVDSVNKLTKSTGIPGNVFVLSEGATDELFSNLAYGDVSKLELEQAVTDPLGRPLAKPVGVKALPGKGGQPPTRLISKETYFVINQEINRPGSGPKRRFVQLRGIEDGEVAGKVHGIELLKGDWFGREGAVSTGKGQSMVPCVLGEGAAVAFGADYGKEKLDVGDTFKIGDLDMIVSGVMKSAGKTFDSETWATRQRVGQQFGKQAFTTVVIRISDDNPDTIDRSADAFAHHLSKNFANPRVRAVPEPRYYEDLAKSNSQLMFMVVVVAIIMALGGVIGVMLVMFAAIAQRIKDVGVMRVVGYKRWQVLVSFMLESLAIALLGGLIGVLLVLILDQIASAAWGGLTVTSTVTAGQGGGKSVVTKLVFGFDVVTSGILFTIVMGRLGGLLPSVGAMRLGILESLR